MPQTIGNGITNSGFQKTSGAENFKLVRGRQNAPNIQAQLIERPVTRHGSDERSPNSMRPTTQGRSRRGTRGGIGPLGPSTGLTGVEPPNK